MSSFKAAVSGLVGIAVVSLFIGCASTKTAVPNVGEVDNAIDVYPKEIKKLVEGKYASSIWAVGIGSAPKMNVAIMRAQQDASRQITQNIKQEMQVLGKSYLDAANDESLEENKQAFETWSNTTVSGETTVKELVTKGKDGYTAYTLKVLSAEKIKTLADEQLNAVTGFKASQAYKEIEDRVAKEKEAAKVSE